MVSPSRQGWPKPGAGPELSRPELSRRGLLTGVAGAGLLAVLAACNAAGSAPATTASSGAPGRRGGVLRAGSPPPPTAVDPVTMYDGSAIAIVQLVAEYLIWLDRDFKLVPKLAESWSSDQGGKRWTFKLRPGVTFSDGTLVDAAAVKASFDRLLDPKSKSAALSAFESILSAGGVSTDGTATVTFALDRPFSDFPYLVSAGNYNAVILKADYGGDFTKNAIGTGPFILKSYDSATGASLTRNEKYWDGGKPYLDGVEIKFYADDQADLLALQSGDIDTQILSRAALVEPLGASGVVTVDTVKGTGVTVLSLRVDQAPFDKKEVRQAVAYGLARPDILQAIGTGIGDLGNDHLLAPLFPAAPAGIPQRAQDKQKVAQLLQAAGVPQLSFTLTFDPPSKDYAVTIQNQLEQVGITVHLDQRSSTDFYGGDQAKDTPWLFTPANLVGWAGRPVPSQFITPMVKSKAVWNGSKYASPALDAAADAYDRASTDADRKAQAETIATILHEDVPIVIAYWSGAVRAYNGKKFDGIQAHPSSFVDFSTVSQK
ncbi:ABC transporter substrate-binding protein [Actinoplanes siamensis]|uniref:Peptide ABC transporter substrate-binding protein n=1 Tax=Actinoplanes siamensis TaxID=1223317 RepID=A0A919TNS6_9ACTN|nr:ABC transporter substrate-binding protein [Actinoplanes siamensis]GIF09037.1 peptide ABC transporter substrate-binding protein [Actinoplanes siamensis]